MKQLAKKWRSQRSQKNALFRGICNNCRRSFERKTVVLSENDLKVLNTLIEEWHKKNRKRNHFRIESYKQSDCKKDETKIGVLLKELQHNCNGVCNIHKRFCDENKRFKKSFADEKCEFHEFLKWRMDFLTNYFSFLEEKTLSELVQAGNDLLEVNGDWEEANFWLLLRQDYEMFEKKMKWELQSPDNQMLAKRYAESIKPMLYGKKEELRLRLTALEKLIDAA